MKYLNLCVLVLGLIPFTCEQGMALHFVPISAHSVYIVPNVDQVGAMGHKM